MDLERELRSALSHERPSAGFADRVLLAAKADTPRVTRGAAPRVWRGLAAAAVLAAVIGGWGLRTIAERRAGERARDEVLLALRITSDKLQDARNHVNDIGSKD
jgi:hypothetical protein